MIRMITTRALMINKNNNFMGSNGWFFNFLRRKNLVLRRITTKGRELAKEARKIVMDHLKFCSDNFVLRELNRDILINMDETSIYLDSSRTTTYEQSGVKRCPAVTTGNEQTKVSIAFSASASSKKLKPMILIPRKTPLKNFSPPSNVVIVYCTNGNFIGSIISNQYIHKVIKPYMILNDLEKVNLFLDCAPCHCTQTVKTAFQASNVQVTYIPIRLTNLL
ncbi:Pogo transposable element with [Brachionus plicatilis]|uniref:Pogo transposable element with n=1 Tax=Brachionus plicatilis TaxID=10195 RepID=A0A3M7QW00_BRAPC|nr:Pogo transposable element with [Brachionus plicatilis]